MSNFVYFSSSRWTKFYIIDLFTNELVACSETDFNELVIKYRSLYDIEYVTPNIRDFYIDGILQARCER